MWNAFLDLFFPRRSLKGKEGMWVTEEERRSLRSYPVVTETSALRHVGLKYIDRIVAASNYHECPMLRKAVQSLKYRHVRELSDELAALLASASSLITLDQPVICPVPLHWRRKFMRGFNQAELLARSFAVHKGWRYAHLVRRNRSTGAQVGRGRLDRFSAVRDAFDYMGDEVPQGVVLVDDVSTTGATLDMCAKALKQAGVRSVQALVLAQG